MSIAERVAEVRDRIARAADDAGRDAAGIDLLLAVKTQSADDIRAALETGHTLIGHNRVQEMAATEPDLDLTRQVHMIGRLQSNKVSAALRWSDCVQSVDSARLAGKLDRAADARDRTLEVFVQVNTSGEATKGGVEPDDALQLCAVVAGAEHLSLRGLMTIGANSAAESVVRASYRRLAQLRDVVVASGEPGTGGATELSMGMSNDLHWAIAEGATMVRVGSAVFGRRE